MAESRLDRLQDQVSSLRASARRARENWEGNALAIINSVESIAVAAALGKAEKEDVLQGEVMGLKLEHGVAIISTVVAVAADDDSLAAHARAFATGAGAVIAYKKMAE